VSGTVLKFCDPRLVFDGTEGVRSHFHVLRFRTHFRRLRVRLVPLACFALPNMFRAVQRASGLVFMFCALGLILGDTEGVGSNFHVLRSQTRFRRNQGRRVPLSCFAVPHSIWAVPTTSSPVFMFCALGIVSHYKVISHYHITDKTGDP
jgi:hypothetical protein